MYWAQRWHCDKSSYDFCLKLGNRKMKYTLIIIKIVIMIAIYDKMYTLRVHK